MGAYQNSETFSRSKTIDDATKLNNQVVRLRCIHCHVLEMTLHAPKIVNQMRPLTVINLLVSLSLSTWLVSMPLSKVLRPIFSAVAEGASQ